MSFSRKISQDQRADLRQLAKKHPKPYVRIRALAIYHLACGRSAEEVAGMLLVHRVSVGAWARRFLEKGVEGLEIESGRGRPSRIDAQDVDRYLRQSPRAFGVARTRWTLSALAQVVPAFQGMTPAGVLKALGRLGYAYKRGQ